MIFNLDEMDRNFANKSIYELISAALDALQHIDLTQNNRRFLRHLLVKAKVKTRDEELSKGNLLPDSKCCFCRGDLFDGGIIFEHEGHFHCACLKCDVEKEAPNHRIIKKLPVVDELPFN